MNGHSSHRRARGSALALAVIVSVIITAMVMALSLVAGAQAQLTGNLSKMDQAFFAAESGADRAAWYVRNFQYKSLPTLTGTVNGYAYSTTTSLDLDSRLVVTSTGSKGTVSYTMSMIITPPTQGIPTFASVGDWDNKNATVTGDIQTAGNYINSGGSGSLSGNLFYGGTAIGAGSVTGEVMQTSSFNYLNWTQVDTALRAAAGATLTGDQNNITFHFDLTPGASGQKVIIVNGNVTDPSFTGTGTIYVFGNVTFTKTATIGNASQPVNIVATAAVNGDGGDISFDKKTTLFGSLYTESNWNRAQTDVTGMVYVGGIATSNSGSSALAVGSLAVPWFDTRPRSGGISSPLHFSNFTGPLP